MRMIFMLFGCKKVEAPNAKIPSWWDIVISCCFLLTHVKATVFGFGIFSWSRIVRHVGPFLITMTFILGEEDFCPCFTLTLAKEKKLVRTSEE